MRKADHFIHYVSRTIRRPSQERLVEPWYAQGLDPVSFQRPLNHVTRATRGPSKAVQPGDSIWLVSQLHSPWGWLAPALDARIIVAECQVEKAGLRYLARPDSRWFPLADASPVLVQLQTKDRLGQVQTLLQDPARPVGIMLQQMRRLASGDLLEQWAVSLTEQPADFISYRIRDGTQKAFRQAKALVAAGVPFFWDRWSLPRGLSERRELVDDPILDHYLAQRIDGAATVWGIPSPLYGQVGSYSAKEQTLACQLHKFKWANDEQ